MDKPRLLLTGFEKFANFPINPTQTLVESFDSEQLVIKKAILPVDFGRIAAPYDELVNSFLPDLIINLGLNASALSLNLETFALNAGKDLNPAEPFFDIEPNGEVAYRTNLNTDHYASALRKEGVPAISSNYAGDYLCNYIYYQSLKWTNHNGGDALFVHLPFTSSLAADIYESERREFASLSKELMLKGVNTLVNLWLRQLPLS